MAATSDPFNGPDGVARRTHPLTVAAAAIPIVIGLGLVMLRVLSSGVSSRTTTSSSSGSPWLLLFFALAAVISGSVQIVRWWFTTYTVLPTELVVDEGVLTREHRVLPYSRVQQADTHQNLIGQVLGLTELRVDCAGASGSTQVKLRLLDAATARALRDYVLFRRAELHVEPGPAGPSGGPARQRQPAGSHAPGAAGAGWDGTERQVLQLGPGALATSAATHNSVIVAVPVLALLALWAGAFATVSSGSRSTGVAVLAVVPIIAIVMVVGGFVHISNTVVRLYGFTVFLAGDDIHLRYGLFETRNLTVPRRRVQQLTLADNPLRRVLGLVELHLHTAASPGATTQATRFSIPILSRSEVDALVTTLMGDHAWAVPALTPRNDAAHRRAIVRRVLALVIVVSGPALVLRPIGILLLLIPLLGIVWGNVAHRRAGHGLSATVAAVSHGAIHHDIDLVPIERVQSCRLERNPMQRLNHLSTLRVDVAGSSRSPYLWDMDDQQAIALSRALPRGHRPAEPSRTEGLY